MKKILALVVAFALCFTAVAGCITTSAEDAAAPEIKVSSIELANTAGATSFTVSGTNCSSIAAAQLWVTIKSGVKFDGIEGLDDAANVATGDDADYYVETKDGNTVVTLVSVLNIGDISTGSFEYKFNVTVPENTTEEAVVYDVTPAVVAGNIGEDYVTVNTTAGTITVAAKAAEPEVCEHNYTYTNNNDGTHSATCANGCGEDIVNEAHTTNGVCVCGVDTRLVFGTPSLTYGSASLEFLFLVSNTVLDLYDNVTVEILPEKYNSSTGNLLENVETIVIQETELAKQGSKNRGYTYKEAFLYELGLNIQYMLKAYDAQGNLLAVSEKFNTSGGAIMKAFHAQAVQYNMSEFATLITDTIIVADEAIKSMAIGKAADSYIRTAESILLGYDTSDKTQSYESYNTVDTFEPSYAGVSKDKSATHRILQGVTIGKLPYLSISIKDAANALDISKLQFTISYTKLSGNGTTTEFNQTFTAADGSIVDGTYIAFNFEDIGVQNSDKDITINVDYDGQDFYDAVYSVETFLGSQLTNENTGSLADALIKLGVSFKNYATK